MEYKSYLGSVEFSAVDGIFFGKVMGIRSLLSYEAANVKTLLRHFMARWMITSRCAPLRTKSRNALQRRDFQLLTICKQLKCCLPSLSMRDARASPCDYLLPC